MRSSIILSALAATFLTACSSRETQVPEVTISRFDTEVAGYSQMTASQRDEFRSRYPEAISFVTAAADGNVDSMLMEYAVSNAVTMFGPDISQRFTAEDSINRILGEIRAAMSDKLPGLRWKDPVGVISTYNQSVILTDSVSLIGLNHYLGEDYTAYSYFDPFQRHLKTQRHLPYDFAEALIANAFPYKPGDTPTLLERILYEGALLTAVNEVVPGDDIAESMGYDDDQWQWLNENESNIWKSLIDRDMLFSVDPTLADRMTRPAPKTMAVHPDAPGRAGRYIGYRIVQQWLRNNPNPNHSTTTDAAGHGKILQWLLSPGFYASDKTLLNSAYTP